MKTENIDICEMKSAVMCLFCGKLLRYKSILSVDERIMALQIRLAVTVLR